MCITDCHDMTLAVKVVLNLNTTNNHPFLFVSPSTHLFICPDLFLLIPQTKYAETVYRYFVCLFGFYPVSTIFQLFGLFLGPLAIGQRAFVMACCVRLLTFSLNIFFSEMTHWILMKFHRNVPGMVLFRISWKNLIPSKTLVAMATKLKFC